MSETAVNIRRIAAINNAASWRSEQENPEFGDITYKSFCKVMAYRREVAKRLLSTNTKEVQDELEKTFEYCNDQLKQLLGL